MNARSRQHAILDAVRRHGRVTVTALAGEHGVTVETIRRDLASLDRAGDLRRIHGGAVPIASQPDPETGVGERSRSRAAAKSRIAAAALPALGLGEGDTLLLDAGTTTGALAALLPQDLRLTVLTDSVLIAAELAPRPGIAVRVTGGVVRGLTQAAVGPEALALLATVRVDVAVTGANGLSAEHGLSTPDPDEAAVKRAMIGASRRAVALLDATKVGQEHLVSFADVDDIDLIVTDGPLPAALLARLHDSGTEVLIA